MNWKTAVALVMLAMLCVMCSLACAEGDGKGNTTFILPKALRVIEEGAFEGTGPTTVYFGGAMEQISARAFADTGELRFVFIPQTVEYIAEDAFKGDGDLVIIGVRGSYADKWAAHHGYRFIHMDLWTMDHKYQGLSAKAVPQTLSVEQPDDPANGRQYISKAGDGPWTTDPKEMPEMYPVDYDFP